MRVVGRGSEVVEAWRRAGGCGTGLWGVGCTGGRDVDCECGGTSRYNGGRGRRDIAEGIVGLTLLDAISNGVDHKLLRDDEEAEALCCMHLG